MNTKLFFLSASLAMTQQVMAMNDPGIPIPMEIGRIKPNETLPPVPKSPIQIPLVYQDGNTLTFGSYIGACTLQLRDADGDVVYETTVAAGATSAILPDATLLGGTGTYELRLVFDDYYFYADITLS